MDIEREGEEGQIEGGERQEARGKYTCGDICMGGIYGKCIRECASGM